MRLITGALLVALLFAFREISLLPDGELRVHVLDVGQGDAILIVTPSGRQILVDGGPDQTVLDRLGNNLSFFDRTLDLIVLTHPDADHVTGLASVLERYDARFVLLTGVDHDFGYYHAFLARIMEGGTPVLLTDPRLDIALGDGVTLDVLWPPSPRSPDMKLNDGSIVLRVFENGNPEAILTGDIEKTAEAAILLSGTDVHAELLKVPHHGSRTSSTEEFLRAVSPKHAVISAGRNNPYGHPHPEIMNRYATLGIPTGMSWSLGHRESSVSASP